MDGCEVYLSIGGSSLSDPFQSMAADPEARKKVRIQYSNFTITFICFLLISRIEKTMNINHNPGLCELS